MKTTEEMIEATKAKVAVMDAFARGEAIIARRLVGGSATFIVDETPSWDWSLNDYRIAPKPEPTKDTIPWDAIDERFRWAARDANSTIAAFECAPKPDRDYWSVSAGNFVILTGNFVGTTPGTIDWRESLQQRPEERG